MSPAPPLPVGTKLGEYVIVRQLDRGGVGTVYEGHQPLIGKRVAIKLLDADIAEGDVALQRFVAEARAVNAIGHRGIVDVFAFARADDGRPYFVMEFLEGRTFERLIAEEAPLDEGSVLGLGRECLEALAAAHRIGIVHRDLKPSNLFLVEPAHGAPYVKVLDFGIAKAVAGADLGVQATREDALLGSPPYMAPEQVLGRSVSPAADVYSLGLVLYELLTGVRAVEAPSLIETLRLHLEGPLPRPAERNPKVSPALDALVASFLEKAPAKRPESAARALELLRGVALATGQPWPEATSAPAPQEGPHGGRSVEADGDGAGGHGRILAAATAAAVGLEVGAEPWRRPATGGGRGSAHERLPRPVSVDARHLPDVAGAPRRPSALRWAGLVAALVVALAVVLGLGRVLSPRSTEAPSAGGPGRDAGLPVAERGAPPPSPGGILGGLLGRGHVLVSVEAPQGGARVSGVLPIEGWAVAPEDIEAVELLVDERSYGLVPYGGDDLGVRGAYPLYRDVQHSRFLMPFNFSELPPGPHRLTLRARSRDGRTASAVLTVDVARLHDSFIEDVARLRLEGARAQVRGERLEVQGLRLDELRYELTLAYSAEAQDFVVDRLECRCSAAELAAAMKDPARAPDAPLGVGFRRPIDRAPAREGSAPLLVLDRPPGGLARRGTVLVSGWALGAREPTGAALDLLAPSGPVRLPGTVLGTPWPDVARHAPGAGVRAFVGVVRATAWPPGRHRARAQAGQPDAWWVADLVEVDLVHFEGRWQGPVAFAPDATARVGARPGVIELSGVLAGSQRHEVDLEFLPVLQRFSITRIEAQAAPAGGGRGARR